MKDEPPAASTSRPGGAEPKDKRKVSPTRMIGRFKVIARLGKGATGTVYRAVDSKLGRHVAIKTISRDAAGKNSVGAAVFLREARFVAQLEHPNIVQIYEIGEEDDATYIVMEFLDGGDLWQLAQSLGPIEYTRASLVCAEAAEGLAYAHSSGVIHRDIKLANLMLSRTGRCKVADFGLARFDDPNALLKAQAGIVGTPAYLAPEIVKGEKASAASDVYSLAVSFWILITGSPPFMAKGAKDLYDSKINDPLVDLRVLRPDLPLTLIEGLERSLDRDPARRMTMDQFSKFLRLHVIPVGPRASLNYVPASGPFSTNSSSLISSMTTVINSASADPSGFGADATSNLIAEEPEKPRAVAEPRAAEPRGTELRNEESRSVVSAPPVNSAAPTAARVNEATPGVPEPVSDEKKSIPPWMIGASLALAGVGLLLIIAIGAVWVLGSKSAGSGGGGLGPTANLAGASSAPSGGSTASLSPSAADGPPAPPVLPVSPMPAPEPSAAPSSSSQSQTSPPAAPGALGSQASSDSPSRPIPPAPLFPSTPRSILFIGDSEIERGVLTAAVASKLEAQNGYHGSGYRSLFDQVGNGDRQGPDSYLNIRNDSGWSRFRLGPGAKGTAEGRGSPEGTCIRGDKSGAVTTVDFYGDSIDLYYRTDPKSGSFSASLDSGPILVLEARTNNSLRKQTFTAAGRGWHTLSLSVIDPPVMLMGVDSRSGPEGVPRFVVHKWGNREISSAEYLNVVESCFLSMLKNLSPTDVVIMVGANDRDQANRGFAAYASNLTSLASKVRAALPKAWIVVASTTPGSSKVAIPLQDSYEKSLPVVLKAAGFEFADVGAWTGGSEKAIVGGWINRADSLLTKEGATKVAGRMLEILESSAPTQKAEPETLTVRGVFDPGIPEVKQVGAWFAADGTMSLDASGRVAVWKNPCSPSYAEQIVADWRPTWVDAVANGHPAVHFDGKSNFVVLHGPNAWTPWITGRYVSVVYRQNTVLGSVLGEDQTSAAHFGGGRFGNKLLDVTRGKINGTIWINGQANKPPDAEIQPGTFQIITFDPGTSFIPATIGLDQSYDQSSPDVQEFMSYLNGDIAELVVFSGPIQDSRAPIEKYLSQKYAIPLVP